MRAKCLFLFVAGFLLMYHASAQQVLTIHGVTSKKLSTDRVSQVVIKDLRSNDVMMSDELGWFTIKAAVGDTLLFTKQDYTDQKIVVLNGSDMPVYLQPIIKLTTVTVQGQSTKQELNETMADYKKNGVFNDGKSLPALAFLTSPLTGIYNLIGTGPKEARHFAAYSKNEQEEVEISKRYNVTLVRRVTNAPDSTIKKFMQYYRPTYDDMKRWNDYDLMKQVKKKFDYYDANKDRLDQSDMALPKLDGTAPQPLKGGANE